jgi:protease I
VAGELDGTRVAILATDYFEESELVEPKKALEQAGAIVTVIAPKAGTIQGVKHVEKAGTVKVDRTLDQANPDEFDALVLPGGAINADALRIEKKAQAFARKIVESRKPLAVICHGPWLLVSADLLEGKKITSYHTIQDDLMNAGADWSDQEVVIDGNFISSRSPKDLPAFNKALVNKLRETKKRAAA